MRKCIKNVFIFGLSCYFVFFGANNAFGLNAQIKGIYITQSTLERTKTIKHLIQQAKQAGINTFVIDFQHMSRAYRKNIELVRSNHIRYVARIVLFPDGGTKEQITSEAYWQTKYKLVEQALGLGAQEIQLDYVRYHVDNYPSEQKVLDIYRVIKWFKQKLDVYNIPLQIDIFGEVSFHSSRYIGQDIKFFADTVDAVCPMVYPSHYEPYLYYATRPYFIITTSLNALKEKFVGYIPFRIYPYIELYNYRYPMTEQQKQQYIYQELRAVQDSNVDGWYAWHPRNKYDNLFTVLKTYKFK